jgi:Aldo/keto reductase family
MLDTPISLLTHALRGPHAAQAVRQLRGVSELATVEALVETVYLSPSGRLVESAIEILADLASPPEFAIDAFGNALESDQAPVRVAGITALQKCCDHRFIDVIARLLRRDGSRMVRVAALNMLANAAEPVCWRIFDAADDPHWRVRHALIQILLGLGTDPSRRGWIDNELNRPRNMRRAGIWEYLAYCWSGPCRELPPGRIAYTAPELPFWDPDPAVLARDLNENDPHRLVDHVAPLLAHRMDRVRRLASKILLGSGQPAHLVAAIELLNEPRSGATEAVTQLVERLDHDWIEAASRLILHRMGVGPATLAWAIDQAGRIYPESEEPDALERLLREVDTQAATVRAALARLCARSGQPFDAFLDDHDDEVRLEALRSWNLSQSRGLLGARILERMANDRDRRIRAEAVTNVVRQGRLDLLESLVADPDASVRIRMAENLVHSADQPERLDRLQNDRHPLVRAAALTLERAVRLIEQPTRETSWHVLAQAAKMRKTPIWKLEPKKPWQPEREGSTSLERICPVRGRPELSRSLAPGGQTIAPLAISGHYGLPVDGFVHALEEGVNVFFWEPNYRTLTEFASRLPPENRYAIHFLAGTFEAEPKRIAADVDRVLRNLGIDCISFFLLFWVQTWARVTPAVRETLDRLRDAGKIGRYGLSTHSRSLAVEAIEADWELVMVRHSAAHRGAEAQVFPTARQRGTTLFTFNNTCYGRLLRGTDCPEAADCYRYSLTQPEVVACISAPATMQQLQENLKALHEPFLPPERQERLLHKGMNVYEEEAIFRKLIRER